PFSMKTGSGPAPRSPPTPSYGGRPTSADPASTLQSNITPELPGVQPRIRGAWTPARQAPRIGPARWVRRVRRAPTPDGPPVAAAGLRRSVRLLASVPPREFGFGEDVAFERAFERVAVGARVEVDHAVDGVDAEPVGVCASPGRARPAVPDLSEVVPPLRGRPESRHDPLGRDRLGQRREAGRHVPDQPVV